MFELNHIAGGSYYIESPTKIGLIKLNDKDVCLIDSGGDKYVAKKIIQILDAQGWHLTAVYNTHSHADHIGGNKYLHGQTNCKIYAPGVECAFTRRPILEPSFLYSGYPLKELRRKFLLAPESDAEYLTSDALPAGFEVIELPGHFFDMVGYRSPDDVVYLADCLLSRETLEKHPICYIYDVAAYLETLEKVKGLTAKMFVPSHAEPTADIISLAQINIDKVHEAAEKIIDICRDPMIFEAILQKLFTEYELDMTYQQYVLIGSTLRSYLAWLRDEEKLDTYSENNMMLWHSIK